MLNGLTLDLQLAPYKSAERDLAALHLKKTTNRDLMLYDRGYTGFWSFALHRHHQREFCMRVPVELCPVIAEFTRSRYKDRIVTLKANKAAKTICRRLGISFDPIEIRLIKIVLSTGEIEVLATTLVDKNSFPHEIFKDLYHLRWGIEEDYKRLKLRFEIENFSGLSVHAIKQDVFAKVLVKNISMATVALAQPIVEQQYTNRKHHYQVNVTQAVSKMKYFILKLVTHYNPIALIEKFIDVLVETVEPIRKGRSFARKENKSRKRFAMNYKRTR